MAPSSANNKRKHTIAQGLADLGIDRTNADTVFDGTANNRDEEFRIVKRHYFRLALVHHPDKGGDADKFRTVQTSFELLRDLHRGKTKRKNSKSSKNNWLFSECFKAGSSATASNNSKSARDDETMYEDDHDDNNEEEFDMSAYDVDFSSMGTPPSWKFYEEAAEETVPTYRVELAKSNRSKCKASGKAKKCREGLSVVTTVSSDDCAANTATDLIDPTKPPELIEKNELRVGSINEQSGTYSRWVHLRCWRVPYKVSFIE